MRCFLFPLLQRMISSLREFLARHDRIRKMLRILFYVVYFCFGIWCSGILVYGTRNLPEGLSGVLAAGLFLTVLLSVIFRKRFVPFLPTILMILFLIFTIFFGILSVIWPVLLVFLVVAMFRGPRR